MYKDVSKRKSGAENKNKNKYVKVTKPTRTEVKSVVTC